jgi:hypothetical protein
VRDGAFALARYEQLRWVSPCKGLGGSKARSKSVRRSTIGKSVMTGMSISMSKAQAKQFDE